MMILRSCNPLGADRTGISLLWPLLVLGLGLLGPQLTAETLVTSDGLGLQTFDTDTLEFTPLGTGTDQPIEALAVDANGRIFAADFQGLSRVAPSDGSLDFIGPWDPTIPSLRAMSFGPEGRLFLSSLDRLYRIDPVTVEVTELAEPAPSIRGLINDGNRLLAAGLTGQSWSLYEVDLMSGALTELYPIAIPAPGGIIGVSSSSMCLDSSGAGLWILTVSASVGGITSLEVSSLDLASGALTDIGSRPTNQGPFPVTCDLFPGAPRVIDVPTLGGAGAASLSVLLAFLGWLTLGRRRP